LACHLQIDADPDRFLDLAYHLDADLVPVFYLMPFGLLFDADLDADPDHPNDVDPDPQH
jgi:hypothetical protein